MPKILAPLKNHPLYVTRDPIWTSSCYFSERLYLLPVNPWKIRHGAKIQEHVVVTFDLLPRWMRCRHMIMIWYSQSIDRLLHHKPEFINEFELPWILVIDHNETRLLKERSQC